MWLDGGSRPGADGTNGDGRMAAPRSAGPVRTREIRLLGRPGALSVPDPRQRGLPRPLRDYPLTTGSLFWPASPPPCARLLDVFGCAMPCAPPRSERRRSARLGHDPGGIAGTARRDSAGCTPSGPGRRCAPWSARRGCLLPGAAHRPLPRTTRTGRPPRRTGRTGIAVPRLAGSRHGVLTSPGPAPAGARLRLRKQPPPPAPGSPQRLTARSGRRQRLAVQVPAVRLGDRGSGRVPGAPNATGRGRCWPRRKPVIPPISGSW